MNNKELLETLYNITKSAVYANGGDGLLNPFAVIAAIEGAVQFEAEHLSGVELSPHEIWELIQAIATEALNPYDEA